MDNVGPREAHRLARDLIENADDLLSEADLLLELNHHARAFFLATIAAEELGKIHLCLDIMSGQQVAPGHWKKAWTNHREKLSTTHALEAAFLRDDVVANFQAWLGGDEVGPWAEGKMAALYVDLDADGHVRRPRDTTAGDAAKAIGRGQAASRLLHTVLDPVTPEILDALPAQLEILDAVIGGLIDEEDPEGSILLVRETLAAATSGDAAELETVLNDALSRLRAKNDSGT